VSERKVKCPRCRAPMFLRRGQYGPYYPCSAYPACDVVRKANKDGTASESWSDGETRRARIEARAEFDQLWKSGQMTRSEAYRWLAREVGPNSPNGEFHIGRADKEQCARVCEAVRLVVAWPDPDNKPQTVRKFVPGGVSLTPYLDELSERCRSFMPDMTRPMPAPSALDAYFAGVAEKHHGGDVDWAFWAPEGGEEW
jgi:ssDNA-binding Zn-finger/Zn-ribbon topoisomerase 1